MDCPISTGTFTRKISRLIAPTIRTDSRGCHLVRSRIPAFARSGLRCIHRPRGRSTLYRKTTGRISSPPHSWSTTRPWRNIRNVRLSGRSTRARERMMQQPQFNLPALIDHTILRPEATRADVLRLCREAKENGFTVIFIPPCYANEAVEAVRGSQIRVGIPIGFPSGGHTTATKVSEALEGVRQGATVLDMVIIISRLKSGDLDGCGRTSRKLSRQPHRPSTKSSSKPVTSPIRKKGPPV